MSHRGMSLIVSRHGERADSKLGNVWLEDYQRNHGRHPAVSHLTRRPNFGDWRYDTPLTVGGEAQARATGKKLARMGYHIDYCYSSPAYRSIQTANQIMDAQRLKRKVPIKIDPGLFECPSWYKGSPIRFVPAEMIARDKYFNIDRSYPPIFGYVDPNEDEAGYYERSRHFIDALVGLHADEGPMTVLLTGHAGSIESLGRALTGQVISGDNLYRQTERVNYCNFAIFEYDMAARKWRTRTAPSSDNPTGAMETIQTSIPLHFASSYYFGKGYSPTGLYHQQYFTARDRSLIRLQHPHPHLHPHPRNRRSYRRILF